MQFHLLINTFINVENMLNTNLITIIYLFVSKIINNKIITNNGITISTVNHQVILLFIVKYIQDYQLSTIIREIVTYESK